MVAQTLTQQHVFFENLPITVKQKINIFFSSVVLTINNNISYKGNSTSIEQRQ